MYKGGIRRVAVGCAITLLSAALPAAAITIDAPAAAAAGTTSAAAAGVCGTVAPTDGGSMALDTVVSGCLETAGNIDAWSFTLTTGVEVSPELVAQSGSNRQWSLRDVDGHVLFAGGFISQVPRFLPPATYALTVTGQPDGYSERSVGWYQVILKTVSVQDFDINLGDAITDGHLNATPVSGIGHLESANAVDRYHFTLNAAQRVSFQPPVDGRGHTSGMTGVLRDSSRRVIYESATAATFLDSVALASGSYTYTVSSNGNDVPYSFTNSAVQAAQQFPATGTYPISASSTLSVSNTTGTAADGTINGATTAATRGAGFIEVGGVDTFAFSVSAATTIDVYGTSAGCGWQYTLAEPNGARVSSSSIYYSHWYVALSAAGTYQLSVNTAGCRSGEYAFTLATSASQPGSTAFKTATAFPATGAYALPLSIGANSITTNGAAVSPAPSGAGTLGTTDNVDVYKFSGSAGQRISTLFGATTDTRMLWQLYAPDGVPLLPPNATLFRDTNSSRVVTLPLTGTYALTLYNSVSATAVSYSLSVKVVAAQQMFALGQLGSAGLSASNANGGTINGAVDPNTSGAGNIDVAYARDIYTFSANAGEQYYLTFTVATQTNILTWQLRAPDGMLLPSVTGLFVPPRTGTYAIVVFDLNAGTGTYSLDLAWAPPAPASYIDDTTATRSRTGATAAAGAVYTFRGTAGQRIFLQHTNDTAVGRWRLDDVDGFMLRRLGGVGLLAELNVDIGDVRLPRSGVYALTIWSTSNASTNYGFSVIPITETKPFALGEIKGDATMTVPNPVTAPDTAGAGNIEGPGVQDVYTFQGLAGEQLKLENPSGPSTLMATVLAPDGAAATTATNRPLSGVLFSNLWDYPLPLRRSGMYTVIVYGQFATSVGTYQLSLHVTGTEATSPSTEDFNLTLDKSATAQLQVFPNDPQVGAGLIEYAGAEDIFHVDAVSGTAVAVALTKTDMRLEGVRHSVGCPDVSTSLHWVLRDPDGFVLFDQTIGCYTGDTGAIVLAKTGTYTVSIGGADKADSYDLTFAPLPTLREAAQPGQDPGTPRLTRSDPQTAVAGHETTITLYGTNTPVPTAIHVVKGGTSLPVTLLEAHAVSGTAEGAVATARIDLTNAAVAQPGNYVVSADLAGGGTAVLTNRPFVVAAAGSEAPPSVDITEHGFDRLHLGAFNRAFVSLHNPSDIDVLATVAIGVPAGANAQVMTPVDWSHTIDFMHAQGMNDTQIAALHLTPQVREDTYLDENNVPTLSATLLVPAHGNSAMTIEMTLPATYDAYAGTAMRTGSRTLTRALTIPGCGLMYNIARTLRVGLQYVDKGLKSDVTDFTKDFLKEMRDAGVDPVNKLTDEQIDGWSDRIGEFVDFGAKTVVDVGVYAATLAVLSAAAVAAGAAGAAGTALALSLLVGALNTPAGFTRFMVAAKAFQKKVLDTATGITKAAEFLLSNACDPNALIGPGPGTEPAWDGGGVHGGERAMYTAEFENIGALPAKLVEVKVPLSPLLDWSTFEFGTVRVGTTDIVMTPRGPWAAHGTATVPLGSSTATVIVDEEFDRQTGELRARLGGPDDRDNPYQPSTHADFLPPNTTKPQGEGSVSYSVMVRDLPENTPIEQAPAHIQFDGHLVNPPPVIDTNKWTNHIVVDRAAGNYAVAGKSIKLSNNADPTRRGLTVQLRDLALRNMRDPHAGFSLALRFADGTQTRFDLPAGTAGWRAVGPIGGPFIYLWSDNTFAHGLKSIKLDTRWGKVTIKGKGALVPPVGATNPGPIAVVLTTETSHFCASFSGTYTAGTKFKGKASLPPTSCTG